MILKNKVAVVFAASGAIAGAVASAMAQKGARVYVSGRDLASVAPLAEAIQQAGGWAEAVQTDALNEAEIDALFQKIVADQGRVDIVFNGIGLRPSQNQYGTPSSLLTLENFLKPITTIAGSQFLTSRIAARYMIETQSQGTILTLTSSLSRSKIPFMAGVTSASTAIEGLTRVLAAEYGMFGIKVICLNPTALTETRTIRETNQASAQTMGIPAEELTRQLSQGYLLQKSPTLTEVGNFAAFLVSDEGAVLNSHIVDVDFGTRMVI